MKLLALSTICDIGAAKPLLRWLRKKTMMCKKLIFSFCSKFLTKILTDTDPRNYMLDTEIQTSHMITSWHWNTVHITHPLCGKSTGIWEVNLYAAIICSGLSLVTSGQWYVMHCWKDNRLESIWFPFRSQFNTPMTGQLIGLPYNWDPSHKGLYELII